MFIRPNHYDTLPFRGDMPRDLTHSARLHLPKGIPKRESLTIKMHKARMKKKQLLEDRQRLMKRKHDNPSQRERVEAAQKLFSLKRRVVDRLLQRKAGNGFGKVRQDTRMLLQAYKEIDMDGDGGVSYDEFETAVGPDNLDIGLSSKEVHELCIACDIDGNGDITFQEFLQTLMGADKPNARVMLDRARARETKFLKESMKEPLRFGGETFSGALPKEPKFVGTRTFPTSRPTTSSVQPVPTQAFGSPEVSGQRRPMTTLSPTRHSAAGSAKRFGDEANQTQHPRQSPVRTGGSVVRSGRSDHSDYDNIINSTRQLGRKSKSPTLTPLGQPSPIMEQRSSSRRTNTASMPNLLSLDNLKTGRFDHLFFDDPNTKIANSGNSTLPVPRAQTASSASSRQHFIPLRRRYEETKPHFKSSLQIDTRDLAPLSGREFLDSRQSGKNMRASPKLDENDKTWKRVGVGRDGTLAKSGLYEGEQGRRSPLRFNKSFDEKGKGWQQWEKKRLNQSGWEWHHKLPPRSVRTRQKEYLGSQLDKVVEFHNNIHEFQDQIRIKGKTKQRYRYMQHIDKQNKLMARKQGVNVGKGLLHSPLSSRNRAGQIGCSGMTLA
eukprot:g1548.t1